MQVVMDGKTADGPAPEMVDIVDHCDRVVATVSRAEMRAHRLQHRAVSIAVVGTDGRLLAGGVVAAGETYEAAARRELAEELGVQCAVFEYLGEGRFADESVALIGRGYLVVHDGPFTFTDGEIAEVRWVTRAELGALMTRERFVPDNVALLLPLLDAR